MPTKYKQKVGAELVGFFSIPAEVLEAYFGAVSKMFTNLAGGVNAETSYEKALVNLENAVVESRLAERRNRACLAALATNDEAGIGEHCPQ